MPDKTAKGKPKFRVGQVVLQWNWCQYVRIRDCYRGRMRPGDRVRTCVIFETPAGMVSSCYESAVRPLTAREIGKRRKFRHDE